MIVFTGCGGGSSGTGGILHEGIVLSSNGAPLPDILVTLAETGDYAYTDVNGFYSFEAKSEDSQVTYLFDSPDGSFSSTVTNIAPTTTRVSADFELDTETETVKQTKVEISEDEHDSKENEQQKEDSSDKDDDDSSESADKLEDNSQNSVDDDRQKDDITDNRDESRDESQDEVTTEKTPDHSSDDEHAVDSEKPEDNEIKLRSESIDAIEHH